MQFDANNLDGATVYDPQGDKIGTVDDVLVDEQTNEPEWLLVDTGVFGPDVMVPLVQLDRVDDGYRVPFSKDQVRNSPKPSDQEELSEQEESELYRYYGIQYGEQYSSTGLPEGQHSGSQGRTQSGHEPDDAMTRSEEVLDTHKVRRPRETVRLKKRIVTENVQQTVPVEHEELVVEREPVTAENRGRAIDGPELTENEHELTLSDEEVVTEKRVEPKERVRIDSQTQTEEKAVDEEIRKEQIDVERERKDQAA